jgi:hypothetical protein
MFLGKRSSGISIFASSKIVNTKIFSQNAKSNYFSEKLNKL